MEFIADLHIHSHFSRATAKNCDIENIYRFAQLKGIQVVGTGDFTHPGWVKEIKDKLEPAEPGLFKLKNELASVIDKTIPPSCRHIMRFILTAEISSIYKKNGKTRKIHSLILAPDIETVEKLNARLDAIGNITSDGRPILGLDTKYLLEYILDINESAYLVPAHIWTPWFSLLGSKSGFDSIEECFEDLSSHIFAIETGLSSDPPMNWRISFLDTISLISNSDAHSPDKLGREANLFDTDISFYAIRNALQTGKGYLGTIEFYPEEGKYHYDGHRKCNIRLSPKESIENKGICPVCLKPLTLGVLYRVEELADHDENYIPPTAKDFYHIIPLKEIISEILQVGVASKKVAHTYEKIIHSLGADFRILKDLPIAEIESSGLPLLGEAIQRMRKGQVHCNGGYDGEYGVIKVFHPHEIESLLNQKQLFHFTHKPNSIIKKPKKDLPKPDKQHATQQTNNKKDLQATSIDHHSKTNNHPLLFELNDAQQKAVLSFDVPLLIVAGPGTGKTKTLTHRIAWFIQERHILHSEILAVTFTQKAANEMKERLIQLIENKDHLPLVGTFHAICLAIIQEQSIQSRLTILDDLAKPDWISRAIHATPIDEKLSIKQATDLIAHAKQNLLKPDDDLSSISSIPGFNKIYACYQTMLYDHCLMDYEDLIMQAHALLTSPEIQKKWQDRIKYIFIDEYQDVNCAQVEFIRILAGSGKQVCVIGDPNQAIYGFRGSDAKYFHLFSEEYPRTETIWLTRNYRSTETILQCAKQVIQHDHDNRFMGDKHIVSQIHGEKRIHCFELRSEKAESEAIVKTIEALVGGVSHFSIDSGRVDYSSQIERSFSDFAVLYRMNEQSVPLEEAFYRMGIPYQIASKNKQSKNNETYLLNLYRVINNKGSDSDVRCVLTKFSDGISNQSINKIVDYAVNHHRVLNDLLLSSSFENDVKGINTTTRKHIQAIVNQIVQIRNAWASKSVAEQLTFLADLPQFEQWKEQNQSYFNRILMFSNRFGCDSNEFIHQLALQRDPDMILSQSECVSLMSLHASKGLEFPVVFITGCEDSLIPFHLFNKENANLAEERRLFYVGITRAKDILYCTWSQKRTLLGHTRENKISPFILNIDPLMIQHDDPFHDTKNRVNRKKGHQQLELF